MSMVRKYGLMKLVKYGVKIQIILCFDMMQQLADGYNIIITKIVLRWLPMLVRRQMRL